MQSLDIVGRRWRQGEQYGCRFSFPFLICPLGALDAKKTTMREELLSLKNRALCARAQEAGIAQEVAHGLSPHRPPPTAHSDLWRNTPFTGDHRIRRW